MAFFRCDLMSESLGMTTSVLVTMPDTDDLDTAPIIYLLHGLTDNCTGWARYTQAEHLARTHIAAIGVGIVTAVAGNKQVASGQRRQYRPPRCAVAVHDGVHLKSITDDKAIKAQLAPQRVGNDRFGQ